MKSKNIKDEIKEELLEMFKEMGVDVEITSEEISSRTNEPKTREDLDEDLKKYTKDIVDYMAKTFCDDTVILVSGKGSQLLHGHNKYIK